MERRLFKDAGNYQEATDGLGIWDYVSLRRIWISLLAR